MSKVYEETFTNFDSIKIILRNQLSTAVELLQYVRSFIMKLSINYKSHSK